MRTQNELEFIVRIFKIQIMRIIWYCSASDSRIWLSRTSNTFRKFENSIPILSNTSMVKEQCEPNLLVDNLECIGTLWAKYQPKRPNFHGRNLQQ